jgi:dTDP-glucose 4,6-dehydratase
MIAMSFHASFETPVATVRPFNTYGPRQSARAVIPTIISQIANGATTIKLGDLTPTRDFNYVSDTVAGFIAVAQSDDAVGEVINIGSNFEVSIGDTARIIAEQMGRDIQIVQDDQRIRPTGSEVERLWASNAKAQRLCGWKPAYGGLDGFRNGISETIAWFQEPENLSRYKSDIYNL